MNKNSKACIDAAFIVTSAVVAWHSDAVLKATIIEIQKTLIGFAGLVVTIFGIWIAVVFPVLSGFLADGKAKQEVSQLARYDVLVAALYRSCFSLTACFFVFLVLSFSTEYSVWVARSAVFFCWLTFFGTAWALWSAIWSGENAVVSGIDGEIRSGLVKRLRRMGKTKGVK